MVQNRTEQRESRGIVKRCSGRDLVLNLILNLDREWSRTEQNRESRGIVKRCSGRDLVLNLILNLDRKSERNGTEQNRE